MSKSKSLDTIRIQNKNCNKKHNVPREICGLIEKLEKLEFVESVGLGQFTQNSKEAGLEITGYDDIRQHYIINAKIKKYAQKLYLKVQKHDSRYLQQIKNCF